MLLPSLILDECQGLNRRVIIRFMQRDYSVEVRDRSLNKIIKAFTGRLVSLRRNTTNVVRAMEIFSSYMILRSETIPTIPTLLVKFCAALTTALDIQNIRSPAKASLLLQGYYRGRLPFVVGRQSRSRCQFSCRDWTAHLLAPECSPHTGGVGLNWSGDRQVAIASDCDRRNGNRHYPAPSLLSPH